MTFSARKTRSRLCNGAAWNDGGSDRRRNGAAGHVADDRHRVDAAACMVQPDPDLPRRDSLHVQDLLMSMRDNPSTGSAATRPIRSAEVRESRESHRDDQTRRILKTLDYLGFSGCAPVAEIVVSVGGPPSQRSNTSWTSVAPP